MLTFFQLLPRETLRRFRRVPVWASTRIGHRPVNYGFCPSPLGGAEDIPRAILEATAILSGVDVTDNHKRGRERPAPAKARLIKSG
jgi:hypothetical protein